MSQQNIPQVPQQHMNAPMPQMQGNPNFMQQQQQRPQGPPQGQHPGHPQDFAIQQAVKHFQQGGHPGHKKERPPSIYVANLPENFFNLELEKLFKAQGLNPIGATVCVDKVKKKPLNYGFVSFSSQEAAQTACNKMNNFELKGKYLRVSVQKSAGEKFDTEANLFIRNLAVEVTQKEFFDFFSQYGPTRSTKIECFQDGRSRGFGYIQFENPADATKVLDEQDKTKFTLHGKQFEIFKHQEKTQRGGETTISKFSNLFVSNLPEGMTEAKLSEVFGAHGEILSAVIKQGQGNSRSGFVSFKDPANAASALQSLNKKKLEDGTFLLVSQHISKRENEVSQQGKTAPIGQSLAKNFDSNLFIKNIPTAISEQQMVDLFGKYGAIVSIKFRVNPHVQVATYKQGFVLYDNVESAKLAIKNLDQSNIFSNKPLGVEFWVSKQELENERINREQSDMFNWQKASYDPRDRVYKLKGDLHRARNNNNSDAPDVQAHINELIRQISSEEKWIVGPHDQPEQQMFQGGGFDNQNRDQNRGYNQNQNRGYNNNRGGGFQKRGGGYQGGRNQGGNNQPIMNQNNFPANNMMAPQQQQKPDAQAAQIRFPQVDLGELSKLVDRADKAKFVGNAIFFPIQDVYGEMAGKITGCLLDGVADFDRLVKDQEFLQQQVSQVHNLLTAQQQVADVSMQQQMQAPPMQGQPPMQMMAPPQMPGAPNMQH